VAKKPAVAAGTRRVGFIYLADGDAVSSGLVRHVLDELTVRPLADLLVGVRAFVHTVRDVAHVPDRQVPHVLCSDEVDLFAAGLVQMVALLAVQFGRSSGFLTLQSFPASRSLPTARQPFLIRRVAFVTQLLVVAQPPPVDNQRVPLLGASGCDVDLAKIDVDHQSAGRV